MAEPEWTAGQVREFLMAILAERDQKYSQRFEAQERQQGQRFEAQESAIGTAMMASEKAVGAAMAAAGEAVAKAEAATERRFEGVNAFRAQLSDQAATFVTRNEFAVTSRSMNEKVDELKSRTDLSQGRASGLSAGWAVLIASISMLGILVGIVLALRR